MRTADDALAIATLSKWLPGFIQLNEPGFVPLKFVELAEGFSVRAEGRTVSLSFTLPESGLRELAASMQHGDW